MFGYTGENERVLPASPTSSSQDGDRADTAIAISDSDDESRFVMDPSDPRAHDKSRAQRLAVHPTRDPQRKRKKSKKAVGAGASVSRWDSGSSGQSAGDDDDNNEDEDVGERVPVLVDFSGKDEEEVDEKLGDSAAKSASAPLASSSQVKLSKWALARFLVPREERTIPVFEELPIEPLNDHILSDFSARFRGATGELEVTKTIDSDDDDAAPVPDKFTVGAPLYDKVATETERAPKRADDESKAAAPNRKRRENRYFITDLATKCFNCEQIGHMSSLCMNDKVLKPCYYCGLRGHNAMACPHLPCPTCLQLGHTSRDCTNRPLERTNCGVCGRTGHVDADCMNADAGLEDIRCMVCLAPGHLHCVPLPPPADRKLYCPNCTDRHLLSECPSYVEPSQPNYATSNFRLAMKCFVCQQPGHLAAACPSRASQQQSRFNCFKCGGPGHYASDCTASRSGGNGNSDRRESGRKRSREHSYTADYGDDDDGGDDPSYYHQVPGSNSSTRSYASNRKAYANASVRLDAALPSYRGGNSNGGNSGSYNSSGSYSSGGSYSNGGSYNNGGDRRRGGNGGGRRR